MKYEKGPSEQPDRPERSPEEILGLAAAIADRQLREKLLDDNKDPNQNVSATDRAFSRGQAAVLLQRLDDPTAPFDIGVIADWYDTPGVIDEMYEQQLARGDKNAFFLRANPEKSKEFIRNAQMKILHESLAAADEESMLRPQEPYIALLPALEQTAQRHGLPVETVLRSDDLYTETVRTAYTPEEYARYQEDLINQLNADYVRTLQQVVARQEYQRTGRTLTSQEADAKIIKQSEDPAFKRRLDATLMKRLQRNLQQAQRRINRYWSAEELQTLPANLQYWIEEA